LAELSPDAVPCGPEAADGAVSRVAARAAAWREVEAEERAGLLAACARCVTAVAEEWAARGARAKGFGDGRELVAEERLMGPWVVLRHLRLYRKALSHPPVPRRAPQPDGRTAVRVLPAAPGDRLLFPFHEAVSRLGRDGAPPRRRRGPGGVAVVLGAGNVSSIPPLDVLWQLLAEDRVVVLKPNPVAAWQSDLLVRAFAPLVEAGFLAVVDGGAATGAALVGHPDVDAVHLTGSAATFDAVVWGVGAAERARRKAAGVPLLTKEVTAELGCVTPALVVPGRWRRRDLRNWARSLVGMRVHNASFDCNAVQVLVTARGWPQRGAFLDEVRRALRETPVRRAWYPGAEARFHDLVAAEGSRVELFGRAPEGATPWALVPDLPPVAGQRLFAEEAWCGVLAETAVDAEGPEDFLERAAALCEGAFWGNLSAVVVAPPATPRAALERALLALRYGTVAVNTWAGLSFALGSPPWGAFPGNPLEDVRSGIGWVHDTPLWDDVERCIVRAPFRPPFRPGWDPRHRTLEPLSRALCAWEEEPRVRALPRLAALALRG